MAFQVEPHLQQAHQTERSPNFVFGAPPLLTLFRLRRAGSQLVYSLIGFQSETYLCFTARYVSYSGRGIWFTRTE